MKSLIKNGLIACILALSFSPIAAQAHTSGSFVYLGLNTGASIINNQSFDHYFDDNNSFFIDTREESSQKGFNIGGFIGWNFYTCAPYLLAIEFSANHYSNRGHYTIDIFDSSDNQSNFEIDYDLDYSFHLTLRPGFLINDSTLFYLQLGGAYGRFDTEIKNLTTRNLVSARKVDDSEGIWGFTLGAGIQKQVTHCFSIFASYEYTYYGLTCLSPMVQSIETEGIETTELDRREALIDSNTLKVGVVFTF